MEVMYTYIQIREYLTNEMWLNSWRFSEEETECLLHKYHHHEICGGDRHYLIFFFLVKQFKYNINNINIIKPVFVLFDEKKRKKNWARLTPRAKICMATSWTTMEEKAGGGANEERRAVPAPPPRE